MKSGIPWNLKGVDAETREAVIAAARRAGMSVGEWLNQVLAADGEGYAEPEETARAAVPPAPDLTSALSQLKARLEEIEQSMARNLERRRPVQPAAPAPRTQKSVQEMVAELAREIENPDESARSMIEGLGTRRAAAGGHPAFTAPPVSVARETRAAYDQRTPERPRLDDIRAHLNALLAEAPKPRAAEPSDTAASQATLIDAALRALESRIDDARAKVAEREAGAGATSATAEHIARVETRLAEISERLADGPARDTKDAELAAAIREIAAHQRTIDDRAETIAIRRDQKALAAAMAALRTDIGALTEQVSAITRIGVEDHGAFFDITRRIDALAAETPVDRTMLSAIRAELESLRTMVEQSHLPSALGEIDARSNGIAERIGDLIDRAPDRARIDELAGEVAAIRRALETDDSPRAIQRLEMRMAELGRAIEAVLTHRTGPQQQQDQAVERLEGRIEEIAGRIESLRDTGAQTAAIATVEQRLEGRLNDMASRLVGGLMDTTSHAAAIETAQHRLESRLEDIVAQLGGIADAVPQSNAFEAAQQQLDERLEDIVARLGGMFDERPQKAAIEHIHERLHGITDRIDALNATQREPSAALDAVKAEIGALRAEIAGQSAPIAVPSTEHLEEQIRSLAIQLETVTARSADTGALAELEDRVTTLASELEQTPRVDSLRQVENNLERLQALLADTTRESIEGARAEARKAVTELSEVVAQNDIDTDLVRGLMRDLDVLKAAAGAPDETLRTELTSVDRTLNQVVERLGRLEREATAAARGPLPEPVPEAAPAEPARKLAPTPPVARPVKRPAEQRADFIAAARRAAQASARMAAEETPAVAAPAPDVAPEAPAEIPAAERKPGTFARIRAAVRGKRRPLLLAAAAIVLAIGAIEVYGRLARPADAPMVAAVAPAEPAAIPAMTPPASGVRNVVREASAASAPLPTVPRAAETSLVGPPAAPDTALAFAAPAIAPDRFGEAAPALSANAFAPAGGIAAAAAVSTEDGAVMLAAAPEQAPGAASGLDPRIGSDKLLTAADSGDPAAAFEIATRYAEGAVVPKDLARAATWYQRAAEGGVAVAQYRLASLYERGQGVDRDLVSAVNWYQRAADQGNINAMHNLAVLMSEGVEGAADHDKALQWFLAAANYGVRDSQYNLGVIYARALGPEQDLIESYKWFAIAAAQGDTDAAERRDEVAKAMNPDDLARARAAVTAWHVKPPLAEANAVSAPGGGWDGPGEMLSDADRQALVTKIQVLLAEAGYDPGPVDGMAGPKTVEAVRAFQRETGQPETGRLDESLMASLANPM